MQDDDFDFAAYDRGQQRIVRHILFSFLSGFCLGAAAVFAAQHLPWTRAYTDPYAFVALSVLVGMTATTFPWAVLTTFLAALSCVVSATCLGIFHVRGFEALGGETRLNLMLAVMVLTGLTAHPFRHLAAARISVALVNPAVVDCGTRLRERWSR